MTLDYALSDLFIPPLAFIWLGFIASLVGLWFLRRRRGAALGIGAVSLAVALVFGMPAVGTRLLMSLESGLPTQAPPDSLPKAIVILSADSVLTQAGRDVGPVTLERLLAGVRLYQKTGLPVLVSGGAVRPGARDTFAVLMARVMQDDFHVPVRWQETHSTTTWSNASDSAAILEPLGIRSVYLVTSAWHERRAVLAFRHFGLIPVAAPGAFDRAAPGGFVPNTTGFQRSFYALHEWLGLLVYDLRARFAKAPANSAS
jgi:uncharacterized SAM-binding protein YcdF (DUF218 family)